MWFFLLEKRATCVPSPVLPSLAPPPTSLPCPPISRPIKAACSSPCVDRHQPASWMEAPSVFGIILPLYCGSSPHGCLSLRLPMAYPCLAVSSRACGCAPLGSWRLTLPWYATPCCDNGSLTLVTRSQLLHSMGVMLLPPLPPRLPPCPLRTQCLSTFLTLCLCSALCTLVIQVSFLHVSGISRYLRALHSETW